MPPLPPDVPEPLPIALMLATTGGLLDAVTYLNHGHVFANAMTGNVVFLGISVLSRNWLEAIRHITPLAAFLAGVSASKLTRTRLGAYASLAGLSIELFTLGMVGFLPGSFPEMAFTAIIAFVAALQISSFRHVQSFSYNSTFVTGNLRNTIEGLYDALMPGDLAPAARRKAFAKSRDLGLICVSFLGGAIAGAIAAPHLGNRSYWLAEPLLGIVLLAFLRR